MFLFGLLGWHCGPLGDVSGKWWVAKAPNLVIPAKAGIQCFSWLSAASTFWIPAFAGMTNTGAPRSYREDPGSRIPGPGSRVPTKSYTPSSTACAFTRAPALIRRLATSSQARALDSRMSVLVPRPVCS